MVSGQVLAIAGSLVLVRVLTEHLDPEQYGRLALGLTVAGLVNQVILGGIIAGIGRFYSIAVEKQDLSNYLRASNHLFAYAAVATIGIGILLMVGLLWLGYSQWMMLAAAALLFSLLSGYNSSLNGIQNAARQRHIVAFHGGLDAWLKIFLAMAVISWLGTTSTAVVIGYACSSILVTGSQLIFLRRTVPRRQSHARHSKLWMSQIWAYSWPFSTWGVFTWIQQVSDRWALQIYSSTAEVGEYAVLFQIGYAPIILFSGMAMSFLGPILYQRSGDATDEHRNANVNRLGWHLTYLGLAVTLSGFVFAFFLHDWLFGFLVAADFRASSYLLPWVILAGGFFAAGQMLALKLMSDMKSASMISAKTITALMGISFNIIGAAIAGIEGVVGALVAFSLVYLAWMVSLAAKTPNIE